MEVITPLSYLVPKVKFFLELNTRSLAGISVNYPIFHSFFFFLHRVKLKVILSNLICTIKGSKLSENIYLPSLKWNTSVKSFTIYFDSVLSFLPNFCL